MHLEYNVPDATLLETGLDSASSATNQLYANVGRLVTWDLPQGLCGYNVLPLDLKYYASQVDPTIQMSGETDTVWASRRDAG